MPCAMGSGGWPAGARWPSCWPRGGRNDLWAAGTRLAGECRGMRIGRGPPCVHAGRFIRPTLLPDEGGGEHFRSPLIPHDPTGIEALAPCGVGNPLAQGEGPDEVRGTWLLRPCPWRMLARPGTLPGVTKLLAAPARNPDHERSEP